MKAGKRIAYVLALAIFLILTLGPFIWTFVLSVTPEYAMMEKNTKLLPDEVTYENYRELLTAGAQKGSVLIPVMATIIPLFRLFVDRKWLDDVFWLSMVYVSSYLPLVTWLMSNYFATIPKELEESAMIDGCGRMSSFLRIILPASYPIILSAALIMFLNTWSQFQIPLILASSLETKPVAIVVSEFMTKDSVQYGLTAAAGMIAVVPPAVAAFVFRRFLISGMMGGAVKG